MANVLLIILLFISIIMIGLILIQRSEGGALGIGGGGGGGGGGGLMSGRGTADMVSKMTGVFGAAFLAVCLMISIAFNMQNQDQSLLDAKGAEKGLVVETPVGDTAEEIKNESLNKAVDESNTVTPLAEDSQTEESTATPEEKTDNKPED